MKIAPKSAALKPAREVKKHETTIEERLDKAAQLIGILAAIISVAGLGYILVWVAEGCLL